MSFAVRRQAVLATVLAVVVGAGVATLTTVSPFQASAFPWARVRGRSTTLLLAGSATTSRDQVSGTSPISRSFSAGSSSTPVLPLSK